MDDDLIRHELDVAAGDIEVGASATLLSGVHSTVVRRRRRRAALGALGAVVVLAAGAVVVISNDDSDGDQAIRTATPPPTVADLPPATDAPVASPTGDAATATTAPADVEGGGASSGEDEPAGSAADDLGWDGMQWLVPWKDGFLAGGVVYSSQPLPPDLPPEVSELFPQEVRDLFADGLPRTIDEATEMLSEAGLLDEVTAVLAEHPEAGEVIYSVPAPEPQAVFRFSVDGTEWSPVEVDLPLGSATLSQVVTGGDRLVGIGFDQTDPGLNSVVVVSTTDLTTWTTQTIDITRPPELPDVLEFNAWPSSIAATDRGWVVAINISAYVQVESLLPADVLAELTDVGGYGMSTDDGGVEIHVDASGAAGSSYRYTWEDLGVGADVLPYVLGGGGWSEVWAAPFDGVPAVSPIGDGYVDSLMAAGGRFIQVSPDLRTSVDGLTWTTATGPVEDGYVSAAIPDGDGLSVFVTNGFTTSVYRADASLTEWEPLEIPGAPALLANLLTGGVGASAIVVDAAEPQYEDVTVEVEVDGYRLTMGGAGPVQYYSVVDIATGDVVAAESVDHRSSDGLASDGQPYAYLRYDDDAGALLIADPQTGANLVTVPYDELDKAYEDAVPPATVGDEAPAVSEYQPDPWLLAPKRDGGWLVEHLGGSGPNEWMHGPFLSAVNGDTLLVTTGSEWLTFNLGS